MLLYREKYGPFNQTLRTDAAVARAMLRIRGGTMADYMPWPKEPEVEATIEDIFAMIKTAAASNKGKK